MNHIHKTFFDSLSIEGDIRWKSTNSDVKFFNRCANKLKSLKVKTILDIACGSGEFVDICNSDYEIEAYGISPNESEKKYIYHSTFQSVLKNQHLLRKEKFDCISILNTVHGGQWLDNELIQLLNFMKKYSNYIVITDPINNPNVKLDGLEKIHSFQGSHGDKLHKPRILAFHKIYKVTE